MTLPRGVRLLRTRIDLVDATMRRLLRRRRSLVFRLGRIKRAHGLPPTDAEREQAMLRRAEADGARIGLAPDLARDLLETCLRLCRSALEPSDGTVTPGAGPAARERLLALLPPPARLAPLLSRLPSAPLARLAERALGQTLSAPLAEGELDPIEGRTLAIEAVDVGLRIAVVVRERRLRVLEADSPAEATIRGNLTDLMRLAARVEDADTLFFHRALQLTGDVELGLTARNLLDRLTWERLPLGPRILLHRAARLAEAARSAYRARRRNAHDDTPPGLPRTP